MNHSLYFVDPETGVHTNTIEGNWTGVKMMTPPRNRTKDKIETYLLEFIWRRQNINNPWEKMFESIKDYIIIKDKPEKEKLKDKQKSRPNPQI